MLFVPLEVSRNGEGSVEPVGRRRTPRGKEVPIVLIPQPEDGGAIAPPLVPDLITEGAAVERTLGSADTSAPIRKMDEEASRTEPSRSPTRKEQP
jgi:hypothetical protein